MGSGKWEHDNPNSLYTNFKVHLLNTMEPSKLCNLHMKMKWMLENIMKDNLKVTLK
jgi:hypothetical protein